MKKILPILIICGLCTFLALDSEEQLKLNKQDPAIDKLIGNRDTCYVPTKKDYVVINSNKPLAAQLNRRNTIYVIKNLFDLRGTSVSIPENCVLNFDGGGFKNGTLVGNYTGIEAEAVKIFNTNVEVKGTWKRIIAYPEWFGAKGDGVTDELSILQKTINSFDNVRLDSGKVYCVDIPERHGLSLRSNITLDFNGGVIKMLPSSLSLYEIIYIYNCSNIRLLSPRVIGDKERHLGERGESGMGIAVNSSHDIEIINARISDCWGDGVFLYGYSSCPYNIFLRGTTEVENCRRQGMSIIEGHDVFIDTLIAKDINGTPPGRAFDIECSGSEADTYNINVKALISYRCWGTFMAVGRGNKVSAHVGLVKSIDSKAIPVILSYSNVGDKYVSKYDEDYDFKNKETSIEIDSVYIDKVQSVSCDGESKTCFFFHRYLYGAMPKVKIHKVSIDSIDSDIERMVYISHDDRRLPYTKTGRISIANIYIKDNVEGRICPLYLYNNSVVTRENVIDYEDINIHFYSKKNLTKSYSKGVKSKNVRVITH